MSEQNEQQQQKGEFEWEGDDDEEGDERMNDGNGVIGLTD